MGIQVIRGTVMTSGATAPGAQHGHVVAVVTDVVETPDNSPADKIKRAVDNGDKLLVIVANSGGAVMLEELPDGFPSQELVAKLRLMGK